jgi:hypothetical protein
VRSAVVLLIDIAGRAEVLWARLPRARSPLAFAGLTLVAYGVFVLSRLADFDFDPSAFVVAGDVLVDPSQAPEGLRVLPNSAGYDGQFFYRLALDPWTSDAEAFGILLDMPAYRQQRILYPALAWLLATGRPEWTPAMLILVNWLGLGVIGWLGAALARRSGVHPAWGLLLPFFPGFLLVLARDLSEIVAAALILAGVLCLKRDRAPVAALAFSAAVLAREVALLVPLSAAAVELLGLGVGRKRRLGQVLWLTLPVAVLAAWNWHLWQVWGVIGSLHHGGGLLVAPLQGLFRFAYEYLPPANGREALFVVEIGYVLLGTVLVASAAVRHSLDRRVGLAWLVNLALLSCLSWYVWLEDWGFMRAYVPCHVLGAVLLITSGSRGRGPRWAAALAGAPLWITLSTIASRTP